MKIELNTDSWEILSLPTSSSYEVVVGSNLDNLKNQLQDVLR